MASKKSSKEITAFPTGILPMLAMEKILKKAKQVFKS